MNLYPSLLNLSIDEYQQQLGFALDSGVVKVIQVDIVDGHFADNLTITPLDLVGLDHGELEIDFHLMTEEPMDYVRELVEIKDKLPIRAIIAQVERMSYQLEYTQELKAQEWKVGLSLDLYTPVSAIDEMVWDELDIIQLMTIESGFQGQKFNLNALEKIAEVKKLAKKNIEIIVDGGIKTEHSEILIKNQVNGVTVGSGIWRADEPLDAIHQYSQLMN
jgi:ribulose-phosphate 3-epimerase